VIEIRPQPGPQENFLSTSADIALYGGAAGAGKTWALLVEPLRHINNKDFGAVIFRRTYPQIKLEGGLWDESMALYPYLGASSKETTLEWAFPSGAKVKFAHLQHDKNRQDWQGAQIPLIGWDELTHFSASQFWYLLSRNRSLCGVKPYMRATCNADADSWVADLIAWWIGEDGFPIKERSGVIRWFARDGGEIHWANSKMALRKKLRNARPMSFTFISASIFDNTILIKKDPDYLAKLSALSLVERERLLKGNWKIRFEAGNFFNRSWFEIVDAVPAKFEQLVRYWDKAGTKDGGAYSCGVLMGVKSGQFFVLDVIRGQWSAFERENVIKQTTITDREQYGRVITVIEQEPGSGGLESAQRTIRMLAGFPVFKDKVTGSKESRAQDFSAQCEPGNVKLLRGLWNGAWLNEHVAFPQGKYKDQVDSSGGAFSRLTSKRKAKVRMVNMQ
jgi:predicted phage terminase large subunit-like protein